MPLPSGIKNKITPTPDPPVPVASVPVTPKPITAGSPCKVCVHEQRAEIEEMFTHVSSRGIADWLLRQGFEPIKEPAINRHFKKCVAGAVMRGASAARSADAFVTRVEGLADRLEGYLDEFDEQDSDKNGPKDWRGLSSVVRELRASLELLGKTLGHVRPDIEINIVESPQFVAVMTPIAQITAKCPMCGPAVKTVLTDGGE